MSWILIQYLLGIRLTMHAQHASSALPHYMVEKRADEGRHGCAGRSVLELGSGVSPLCCMAALRHCRKYVATDGSLQACQGLARNLDLNCRYQVLRPARYSKLRDVVKSCCASCVACCE